MHLDELVHSLRERIQHSFGAYDLVRRPDERSNEYWFRIGRAVKENRFEVRTVLEAYAGLACLLGRCRRERAEEAVCNVYEAMMLPRPKFLWFDSPLEGAVNAALLTMFHREKENLAAQFMDAAGTPGFFDLYRSLYEEQNRTEKAYTDHNSRMVRELHRLPAWSATSKRISSGTIECPCGSQLCSRTVSAWLNGTPPSQRWEDFLRASSPLMSVNRSLNRVSGCRIGSGDAWDLSVIHAANLFGVPLGDTFAPLRETMLQCGWWWPLEEFCIMSERPLEINFQGEALHKQDGAAIVFADGSEMYFWKDLAVSKNVVFGNFTARDIDEEPNVETRRAMVDRFGLDKYLLGTNATLIHQDECGMLYSKDMGDDEPLTVVRVKNSTPEPDGSHKDYFLRVPPDMRTAREAVAWTFGMHESEYRPARET